MMDAYELRAMARGAAADAKPPESFSAPLRALWHLARDEWDAAHGAAQSDPSRDGCWVHAHLHRVEGDLANAGYWYRRADLPTADVSLDNEWEAIAASLLASAAAPDP